MDQHGRTPPSNPYAPPTLASYVAVANTDASPPTTALDFSVESVQKSWLYRRLVVMLPEGAITIEYDARMPNDRVTVNGQLAVSLMSVVWFIPKFAFLIGPRPATIDVRIDWLLRVKFFELKIEGHSVYVEKRP